MAQDQNYLIWLDMEMTGLEPDHCPPDPHDLARQVDRVLAAMDEWNRNTHGKSGLIERVLASRLSEAAVEQQMLAFVQQYVPERASPMCGNSVCQDRRFMARSMPALEAWFHYRNLDVSTLKELAKRWRPEVYKGVQKKAEHTALADIYESIAELRHYRDTFLRLDA